MPLFQTGVDVSRYQGNVNWSRVAGADKQFAIVRIGSSNSGGLYVDPYLKQNVNNAHAAGMRVGAYYYTYARTQAEVAHELDVFLAAISGMKLEYPVFVDVEDNSLKNLGRAQLTALVKYALDILYQRKWYGGWYSYTYFINNYLNTAILNDYTLWVADYNTNLTYNGPYSMWQYSSTGRLNGISGACDLNYCYTDYLTPIQAGGYNGYGAATPVMEKVDGYQLAVFGSQTEYFNTPNFNDVVGYLPIGTYPVTQRSTAPYNGYNWVIFGYNGNEYWTALLDDRNRLEPVSDCAEYQRQLQAANEELARLRAAQGTQA